MATNEQHSKAAFTELYDRLGRRLMTYLVRRIHDRESAAEIWAECWATAYENWQRCRCTSAPETEAWVFGIARNLLAGYFRTGAIELRALQRLRWSVPSIDGALDEEIEGLADREALRAAFAQALEELPPARRSAVRLRVIDGLAYPEIAARLGCTEQVARAHVSRGLKRLAELLDRLEMTTAGAVN